MSFENSFQLVKLKRLDYKIVAARGERHGAKGGVSVAGKKDNRHTREGGLFAYLSRGRKAVQTRKDAIHQDQVGTLRLRHPNGYLAILGDRHAAAAHLQQTLKHEASVIMVFDHQDERLNTPRLLTGGGGIRSMV
jgi:hypothetical protein